LETVEHSKCASNRVFLGAGSTITLRQGKARRGKSPARPVNVPCTAALCRMLDGMERTSPLILTTKTGRSFKKRYFTRLWDEATTDAGLETITLPGFDQPVQLHFHDLRGSTVTLLSESGRSPRSPDTHSRPCIRFWNATLRAPLPSKQSSIGRTQREQNLQTDCKPSHPRRQ
jgi:hypothetical protein